MPAPANNAITATYRVDPVALQRLCDAYTKNWNTDIATTGVVVSTLLTEDERNLTLINGDDSATIQLSEVTATDCIVIPTNRCGDLCERSFLFCAHFFRTHINDLHVQVGGGNTLSNANVAVVQRVSCCDCICNCK